MNLHLPLPVPLCDSRPLWVVRRMLVRPYWKFCRAFLLCVGDAQAGWGKAKGRRETWISITSPTSAAQSKRPRRGSLAFTGWGIFSSCRYLCLTTCSISCNSMPRPRAKRMPARWSLGRGPRNYITPSPRSRNSRPRD